jgi:hypothetical protein
MILFWLAILGAAAGAVALLVYAALLILRRSSGPVQEQSLQMQAPSVEAAHKHSSHHRTEIEASQICGCFYCFSTYPPSAIIEWIDDVPLAGQNQSAM